MNYQALAEAALAQFMTQSGFAVWWNRVIPVTKDELLDELAGALQVEVQGQKTKDLEGSKYLSVEGCASCGQDHSSILFAQMVQPLRGFTHFGVCPNTTHPILCREDLA